MVWLYSIGMLTSIGYLLFFWYDVFVESKLNDLMEVITISFYIILAVSVLVYPQLIK